MQIPELATKLENLGLTDKEARVYVAALFLGPASAQKIASQAEINRATAYVILDQLADLGLMSHATEDKKTVFVAEAPEALNQLFDRQKEVIEDRQAELKRLLPDLIANQRGAGNDEAPVVRFYKGTEGVRSVSADFRRAAKPGTVVYGFVNYDGAESLFPDILRQSSPARLKKKISSKMLYSYSRGEVASNAKIMRETKKLDEPAKADITLYEDRVAFATYDKVVGVAIESRQIVGALRQLFELAWKNQK